jgi:hypothetical protein
MIMKNTNVTPFLFALFAAVCFCNQSRAQNIQSANNGLGLAMLSSSGTLEGLHKVMEGSLDLIKVNNKGVSYVDAKDRGRVAGNIGFLIAEGFTFGGKGQGT